MFESTTRCDITTDHDIHYQRIVRRARNAGLFKRSEHELDERASSLFNQLYNLRQCTKMDGKSKGTLSAIAYTISFSD